MIDAVLEYATAHPGQGAGAVATLGAAGFHTVKTGNLPLGRLPWRTARDLVDELQAEYYGKPRPTGVAGVVVDAKPAAVKAALRDVHFEGTQFSYDRQELWDLRRPAGTKRHPETGREIPMELHVRAYELADGRTLLLAHYEASRYEAQGVHVRGTMVSWDAGQGMLASTLHNDTDLDHTKIESEREAGIEVTSG